MIFEYYNSHDVIRQNPQIVLEIYEKVEDNECHDQIKVSSLKCLIALLQYMKGGSFDLINKTAIRYSR